jgi:hypothetical protein
MRRLAIIALLGSSLAIAVAIPADAGPKVQRSAPEPIAATAEHPKASYYRRAPQVRGFLQRRGGYSFSRDDVTTTLGGNRIGFDPANPFRGPFVYN